MAGQQARGWRPSLHLTIGIILAGLILVTAATLTAVSYLSTRRTLLGFSRTLIAQNADLVGEQVQGYLNPARSAATLTLAFVEDGLVDVKNNKQVERYFFDFLRVQKSVAMLNYGDEQGNFIMVKRKPGGALWTKIVSIESDGSRRVRWHERLADGPFEPPANVRETPDDQYDPRTRPWYRGAMNDEALHWTDVYIFHSDKRPGVTAAIPYKLGDGTYGGVLSVDIGLVDVSHFLRKKIRVGTSGQAFLLDGSSQLIATMDVDALTVATKGATKGAANGAANGAASGAATPRLRRLSESTRPEIAALAGDAEVAAYLTRCFSRGDIPAPITRRYRAAGHDYVATLLPIEVGGPKRWIAGVVALEDEFLATAKKANVRSLITGAIFAGIALLLGVLLANFIARSLRTLLRESQRVQRLELDATNERSWFREVDEVLAAFDGMKSAIRAFSKYVPFNLVRRLVKRQVDPVLGGEPRTLTIFFSDIRGFTSISEELEPLVLANVLGDYLSCVTRTIHERHGTVDKYIGDAVMAFWGAPDEVEKHAEHACHAALESLSAINALRDEDPRIPEFYTRIGLHTSNVVVGNFGSDDRISYTIIGDGVNLASRLEGVNKMFGTQILLSKDTRDLVCGSFETRKMGLVSVKGREQPCATYELMGAAGSVAPARVEAARLYEQALDLYLAREWAAARAKLGQAIELRPDDHASEVLIERCTQLEADPPHKVWSGVIAIPKG